MSKKANIMVPSNAMFLDAQVTFGTEGLTA